MHDACAMLTGAMRTLQIRNLPDDVYEALRWRAERAGRSLAQQAIADLRLVPETAARERRHGIVQRLRSDIAVRGERSAHPSPESLIREDRDR
jgi:antitoxin FitA